MTLKKIKLTLSDGSREITSVLGVPFYQSTGNNSKNPKTWFPFHGIAEDRFRRRVKRFKSEARGHFKKPSYLNDKLIDLVKSILGQDETMVLKPVLRRMSTVNFLIISSILGEGFWDTPTGKKLLEGLTKLYPEMYPLLQFNFDKKIPSFEKKDIEVVNQWLEDRAKKWISIPEKYCDFSNSLPYPHLNFIPSQSVDKLLCKVKELILEQQDEVESSKALFLN